MILTLLPSSWKKTSMVLGEIALALVAGVWAYSIYPFHLQLLESTRVQFGGFYIDGLSATVSLTAILVGMLVLPASNRLKESSWQFDFALLLGVAGTIALSSSTNAFVIVAGWGLVAVSSYSMVSLAGDRGSLTGSIKYAFMSALSFQFLVVSIFLIISSTSDFKILSLGMILFLVALGFKGGIPPFHMWLPDVYGYSDPVPVSMLSSTMKLGALALAIRLLDLSALALPIAYGKILVILLVILSIGAMLVGNLGGLTQSEVQRMMAYSSIAHVGYMTMALAVFTASLVYGVPQAEYYALVGLLIYFTSYALSKAGAFAFIKGAMSGSRLTLQSVEGLGSASPLPSGSLLVILLNLIGVPPLLGFWGKLFIFASAANQSITLFFIWGFPWFTLVAIANSALSVFYYIRVMRSVYSPGKGTGNFRYLSPAILSSLGLIILGVLLPLLLSI